MRKHTENDGREPHAALREEPPCGAGGRPDRRNNVVLIGMPGVGKTTIGRRLSALSGLSFSDTDRVIETQTGKTLPELIAARGTEGFLAEENRICAALKAEGTVIATGGSVVYGEDAMKHLSEIGVIVYLKLNYSALNCRLRDLTERGVALKPGQTLQDLYNERVPLYETYADITIDEQKCSPAQTAARLHRALRRMGFFRGLGWMRGNIRNSGGRTVPPHGTAQRRQCAPAERKKQEKLPAAAKKSGQPLDKKKKI